MNDLSKIEFDSYKGNFEFKFMKEKNLIKRNDLTKSNKSYLLIKISNQQN